jgi:hypothetical protein
MSSYSDDKNLKAEEWYYYLLVPFTGYEYRRKKTLNSEVTEDVAIYYSDLGNRVLCSCHNSVLHPHLIHCSKVCLESTIEMTEIKIAYIRLIITEIISIFSDHKWTLLRSMVAILLHTKEWSTVSLVICYHY